MAAQYPKVGVAAVISDANGKFLVSKRKGGHGAGTWQFPGGHLEYGEAIVSCAERETEEETALVVKGAGVIAVTNDVFETDNKHYITLFVSCVVTDPEAVPQLMEPEKCEGWHWKTWEELKQIDDAAESGASGETLFLPIVNLLRQTTNIHELMASRGL
ncbi:NUDIX hydrolase domain-like protein [Trichoderma ceciliae]